MSTNSNVAKNITTTHEMRWIAESEDLFLLSMGPVAKRATAIYNQYGSLEMAAKRHAEWLMGFFKGFGYVEFPCLVELSITMPTNLKRFPRSKHGKRMLENYFYETCSSVTECTPLSEDEKELLKIGDQEGAILNMLKNKGVI